MRAKNVRRWTEAEDEVLRAAVRNYREDGDIDWHEVASYIENRNNKDCRKRWIYTLAPSINKGCWNKEEDDLLMKGIQMHGFQWVLVSQVIGTRQPDQCSRRWHQSLNPNIKYGRWSLTEDRILNQAVQIHGRKWTEIVDRYFPDRTPIAAKKRYTERFKLQNSSSEDITRLQDDETITAPEKLIQLENERTENQESGSTDLWGNVTRAHGQGGHNFSAGRDIITAAATPLYKSNSLSNLPTTNHLFDATDFSSLSTLSTLPTSPPFNDSSSPRQKSAYTSINYSSNPTALRNSSMPSSPYTLNSVLDNNDPLSSQTSEPSSFPQPSPLNIANNHHAASIEHFFPDFDPTDGLFFGQIEMQALLQPSEAPRPPRSMPEHFFSPRANSLQQAALESALHPSPKRRCFGSRDSSTWVV